MWLLLMTPEAEPVVDPWRAEHDSAARYGIPAHVTVRAFVSSTTCPMR